MADKLPELFRDCQTCQGAGKVDITKTHPDWIAYHQERQAWLDSGCQGPVPECPTDGDGEELAEEAICSDCEGSGREYTEAGKQILELLAPVFAELRGDFQRDIQRLRSSIKSPSC